MESRRSKLTGVGFFEVCRIDRHGEKERKYGKRQERRKTEIKGRGVREREDFTHAPLQSDNHVSLHEFQTQSARAYTHKHTGCI